MTTHEEYIRRVLDLAIAHSDVDVPPFKLTYGAGADGLRGVTYYGQWNNGEPEPEAFVEICAKGEANPVQLAGTTIHEVAHVVAGYDAGHGPKWRAACAALGLRGAKAAGMHYQPAHFAPALRYALAVEPTPEDGSPNFSKCAHLGGFVSYPAPASKPRPCTSVTGCKGGKSRGKGSGSRLVKLVCDACGYIIRTTRKWADIGTPTCCCGGDFAHA